MVITASGISVSIFHDLLKNGHIKKQARKSNFAFTVMEEIIHCGIIPSEQSKHWQSLADKSMKYGLKWVVKGTYNGKSGVWELVINTATNTIVHFLFRSK